MSTLNENQERAKCGEPGTAVLVAMSGISAQTAAALTDGQLYVITCASAYHYAAGADPTATTNSPMWPANVPNYITGTGKKYAFINVTEQADATVFITPLNGYRV